MALALALLIIGLSALILFKPKLARMAGRKIISLLVNDLTKTPEGAELFYSEAIREKQSEFDKAAEALNDISNTISAETVELSKLKGALEDIEKRCENLVRAGQLHEAKLLANERQGILQEIDDCEQLITNLSETEAEAQRVVNILDEQLRKLQREKKQTINNLKFGQQIADTYHSLDNIKKENNLEMILDDVKESAIEKSVRAVNARVVHESSMANEGGSFEHEIRELAAEDYLDNLKKKYDKNKGK